MFFFKKIYKYFIFLILSFIYTVIIWIIKDLIRCLEQTSPVYIQRFHIFQPRIHENKQSLTA
jgi:ABC-type arginine/histidine transport system permease subunit